MKKPLIIFVIFFVLLLHLFAKNSFAIDATPLPNNKFGVHILFPEELEDAAGLVNSSGGDWGYVTIPIQSGDRNLKKWQKFMSDAKKLHLIPIIRIATEGNYFNTKVWRKPDFSDVLDFGNFLNSLDWPTKNRYVVIFNEANRSDEWGGDANPAEYAEILEYAVSVFKSKNSDFFVISAGLDNAAPNELGKFINEYDFLRLMNDAVPGIFNQIDAIASHSYPNPGFSQPPSQLTPKSIASFKYEEELVAQLSTKKLPVFVTETGWSLHAVDERRIGSYYEEAFEKVWSDTNIVAVTPFLLRAGVGPFAQFSLINTNGGQTQVYKLLERMPKIKGNPELTYESSPDINLLEKGTLQSKTFSKEKDENRSYLINFKAIKTFLRWLLKV